MARVRALQQLEWMSYDWRVRLAHRYPNDSFHNAANLGVVEMTDNTISTILNGSLGYKYGLYWPREVYARALSELSNEGAKAVAFDVLFIDNRPDQPAVDLPDGTTLSSDEYFGRQLKASGYAILAADHDELPAPVFKTNAWRLGCIATDRDPDGVLRRDKAFSEFRDWHWIIKQVAAGFNLNLARTREERGQITFYSKQLDQKPIVFPEDAHGMIDTTNVVNPVPPGVPAHFHPYKRVRVWSMGIVLAARELNLDLRHPDIDPAHGRIVLRGTNGLTRVIPVDENNYFYIDWSMGLNDANLTEGAFENLLVHANQRAAGQTVSNEWKDKLVVIGSTTTGNDLEDVGSTSLESFTFLCSKHWNIANSVITGRFIRTTSQNVDFILIILVGTLSAWITWVVGRPVTGTILMTVVAVVYVGVAVWLFVQWRIWLPIILPLVCAGLVTHGAALTYRMTVEQSEKKRIRSLFARLVSPEVVNKVLDAKSISLNTLAGERRDITVYFADIRGFTELTDAAQAENTEFVQRHEMSGQLAESYFDEKAREVMNTVSLYLGAIADLVKKHNGTFDKYIGDCVMAFWGAPLADPHHAMAAVRCAIEVQRALQALNLTREEENKARDRENIERVREGRPLLPRLPILSMGSGINSGLCIAGFMGSKEHNVNYTVFGREVNLASRLEGVSGHGRIIIGEGTYRALRRDAPELARTCTELPPQQVKGFRELVRIFEVPWKQAAPASSPPDQTRDNPAAVA